MRRVLDAIYAAAQGLAAACFAAIAALVLVQIAGRLLDRGLTAIGRQALGVAIPSLAEIGAFLFVAAAFLGLAGTLRAGGHVRVTLLTGRLGPRAARALSALVIAGALALALWSAWHAGAMALDAWRFNSVSYGMVRVPLALPQAAMTLGLILLCVALADELWAALRGHDPAFARAEAAREAAGDGGAH